MILPRTALLLALACAGCAHTTILYSRHDEAAALKAYRLARVYGPAHMDSSIKPGEQWRPAMASAICSGGTVLLLWSARAASSAEVAGELQTARGCGARVVPVLLDGAPLPGGLIGVQAVDWR